MISKCDDLCGSSGCDSLVWSIQTCVYTQLSRSRRPSRFRVQCSETWKDIDLDLWLRDHDKCS